MRRRSRIAIAASVIIGVVLLVLMIPRGHRITRESFTEVQDGMTLQEVEGVLGGPSGDYGPGPGEILDFGSFTMSSYRIDIHPGKQVWLADDVAIIVCFNENGRVDGRMLKSAYRPYSTAWEMLGQRLGVMNRNAYPPGSANEMRDKYKKLTGKG